MNPQVCQTVTRDRIHEILIIRRRPIPLAHVQTQALKLIRVAYDDHVAH